MIWVLLLIIEVSDYNIMNLNWTREKEEKPFLSEAREGFTFTYIPFLKSMLLFGGTHAKSNEIYLYNLSTCKSYSEDKKWRTHKTNNIYRPTPRKFHTAVYSGTSIQM